MNKLNKAYDKSKKILVVGGVSLLGLGLLVTGTAFATNKIAEKKSIGAENARNFAYADAGVDPANVQLTKTEFDREFGQFIYEVDFVANDTEYDYYISASDGSVVNKEIEFRNSKANKENNQSASISKPGSTNTGLKENLISLEQAKQVALTDAGLNEADVRFEKSELDNDDGRLVYDIEFNKDRDEYEYEINANTGDIFSRSIEKESDRKANNNSTNKTNTSVADMDDDVNDDLDDTNKKASSSKQNAASKPANKAQLKDSSQSKPAKKSSSYSSEISAENAKEIALAHAAKQIDVSGAKFSKTKLDSDDGIKQWEIEFYVGATEFEYEINAANGNIIDWDMDNDD